MLLLTLQYDDRIFGLDPQLIFQLCFQALAVFLLFLLGSYLLLDPVRKILNDRKERIMREQKEARESREEAIAFKEEYDVKLKEIDKEAEKILGQSRKKALEREDEIILNARREADRIIANARREAELEKSRAKDEMKQEIINVATAMSEKIVGEAVDRSRQDELFEQTLEEMGEETWQNR